MHWYKHHLGDYATDTVGLSALEHGVYRLLLDAYYSNDGPLPCDLGILYRICHAHNGSERKAVRTVVVRFFTNSDRTIKQKRADQEILKYQAQCLANRRRIGNESASKPEAISQKPEDKESKPLASSDKSLSAVCLIPIVGKKEWPVSKGFLSELEVAYPAVDGPATLREIRAWCVSNPTRVKTERGVARFINRWFEKVQNA